jgi:hypothetical protein
LAEFGIVRSLADGSAGLTTALQSVHVQISVVVQFERASPETRYSPAVCMGTKKAIMRGNPDYAHISTSYVERQNLTMRMSMRRFTRLTNAFSKKLENLEHAVALHYMHYNFCRIHQTLRVTPAMEAGVADHVWSIEEIIHLLCQKRLPIPLLVHTLNPTVRHKKKKTKKQIRIQDLKPRKDAKGGMHKGDPKWILKHLQLGFR